MCSTWVLQTHGLVPHCTEGKIQLGQPIYVRTYIECACNWVYICIQVVLAVVNASTSVCVFVHVCVCLYVCICVCMCVYTYVHTVHVCVPEFVIHYVSHAQSYVNRNVSRCTRQQYRLKNVAIKHMCKTYSKSDACSATHLAEGFVCGAHHLAPQTMYTIG